MPEYLNDDELNDVKEWLTLIQLELDSIVRKLHDSSKLKTLDRLNELGHMLKLGTRRLENRNPSQSGG